jgi:hypothetical protein
LITRDEKSPHLGDLVGGYLITRDEKNPHLCDLVGGYLITRDEKNPHLSGDTTFDIKRSKKGVSVVIFTIHTNVQHHDSNQF